MKKIGMILICLVMIIGLVACQKPQAPLPSSSDGSQGQQSVVSSSAGQSSEQSSQAPETMTFEKFLEQAGGIWFAEDSVSLLYENEYTYTFCSISQEYVGSGVYPGGADRPAKITGFSAVSENVFQLSLLYEAGEFMGDMLPEERATLTVTFVEEGRIALGADPSNAIYYRYGGEELDDVMSAVRLFVA